MKRIMQFRFYSENSSDNYPATKKLANWTTNLFEDYGTVSHLGIQGEPGVVFYLNDGDNPIVLGNTGIYEINLEGIGRISSLRFDEEKLKEYYNEKLANAEHRVLVDIIYDGAEV